MIVAYCFTLVFELALAMSLLVGMDEPVTDQHFW